MDTALKVNHEMLGVINSDGPVALIDDALRKYGDRERKNVEARDVVNLLLDIRVAFCSGQDPLGS